MLRRQVHKHDSVRSGQIFDRREVWWQVTLKNLVSGDIEIVHAKFVLGSDGTWATVAKHPVCI